MKKYPARFTIKFNPTILRHKNAIELLNGSGRCKAALIADALEAYVNYGAAKPVEFKSDKPQNAALHRNQPAPLESTSQPKGGESSMAIPNSTGQPHEEDMWQAVNNSIDSFF